MSIDELSMQINWAINTNDNRIASNLLVHLYQTVQRDSSTLLDLPADDCQSVGLAFTGMALLFNWNDDDINSVAAENAYYCLAKGYIGKKNTFCLPAIFTILQQRPALLRDKLISYWANEAQRQIGMPIGLALGGNPFRSPHLNEFREQAVSHKLYIQQFVMSKIYDFSKQQFTVPSDLPYYLPTKNHINSFLADKSNAEIRNLDDISACEKVFRLVYNECEDTLRNF